MITTTLNRIRAHKPCGMSPRLEPLEGFCKLRAGLGLDYGNDTLIPFARIVEINGLNDALWCCRVEPQHETVWRLYAVWCARQVEHLMSDQRSRDALGVAERHADGLATDAELNAARAAARAAASDAARDTASYAASDAARAAAEAAEAAAEDAAWAAARAGEAAAWTGEAAIRAAEPAVWAVWAARAAPEAAETAAETAWAAQTAKFIEMVGGDDNDQN